MSTAGDGAPGTDTDADTGPIPRVETDPGAEAATEPNPKIDTDANPEIETDASPKAETDASPKVETDASPRVETDANPTTETDPNPKAETDASPKVETDANPTIETETEGDPVAVAPLDAPGYDAGTAEPGSEPAPAEVTPSDPGAAAAAEARWRRIRRQVGFGYLALIVVLIAVVGIPTDRGSLTLVVVAGLAVPCIGRGWPAFRRVLIDWIPFTAALIAYDYSRGLAKVAGQPLHVGDIADIDRDVFGVVPTVWLQQHYLSPGAVHWYDAAATLVYMTHFLATPVIAGVLWLRNRELWVCFVRRVLALAVAGLATYILFPAAPPWYASRTGDIGLVVRGAGRGWFWLHINHAGNLLQEGQAASNPVAAMPSLHTGYATIIALFVLTTVSSRFAWAILLYPAAMAISLVYLGEHYVIDVVAGIVYAVVIHSLASWWERWRERSRERARDRKQPRPDRVVREPESAR